MLDYKNTNLLSYNLYAFDKNRVPLMCLSQKFIKYNSNIQNNFNYYINSNKSVRNPSEFLNEFSQMYNNYIFHIGVQTLGYYYVIKVNDKYMLKPNKWFGLNVKDVPKMLEMAINYFGEPVEKINLHTVRNHLCKKAGTYKNEYIYSK